MARPRLTSLPRTQALAHTAALPLVPPVPAAPSLAVARCTAEQASLLEALGFDPVGLDALAARTGWSAALLQAQLLELELEGLVASLPGGLFQRMAQS